MKSINKILKNTIICCMENVAYPKEVDRFHDSDLLTKVMTFFQDRDERAKRRSVF